MSLRRTSNGEGVFPDEAISCLTELLAEENQLFREDCFAPLATTFVFTLQVFARATR